MKKRFNLNLSGVLALIFQYLDELGDFAEGDIGFIRFI